MSKGDSADIAKIAQEREQQIKMLVNLLLAVLNGEDDARNRAENFLFIRTDLFKLIDVGDEARAEFMVLAERLVKERSQALEQEREINRLKRQIIQMQLGGRWE